jgi:hypothetical protein
MKKSRGSITVEASVVLVTALFVTFFIFFMAAYLYDIHHLQALSTKYVWEAWAMTSRTQTEEGCVDWTRWENQDLLWRMTEDFSEQEQELTALLQQEESGLWFGNSCTFQADLSLNRARITYKGVYHFPFETGFAAGGGIPFEGGVTLSETESAEWIRMIGGVVRGFGEKEDEDGD